MFSPVVAPVPNKPVPPVPMPKPVLGVPKAGLLNNELLVVEPKPVPAPRPPNPDVAGLF